MLMLLVLKTPSTETNSPLVAVGIEYIPIHIHMGKVDHSKFHMGRPSVYGSQVYKPSPVSEKAVGLPTRNQQVYK